MAKMLKNQKRGAMFIVLAIICGLLMSTGFYFAYDSIFKTVNVYVAVKELNPGDPLQLSNFEVKEVPVGRVMEDAVGPDDIGPDNKLETYVMYKGMLVGDVLRKSNTVNLKDRNLSVLSTRLTALETEGLRGIEIPIDSIEGMLSGMAYGDKVSVGCAWDDRDLAEAEESKNIHIISEIIIPTAVVAGVKGDDNGGILVIAVTEPEWLKFMESKEKGEIYVSLIPFGQSQN